MRSRIDSHEAQHATTLTAVLSGSLVNAHKNMFCVYPLVAVHLRLVHAALKRFLCVRRERDLSAGGCNRHRRTRCLIADIRAWIDTWNDNPRPYVWAKTADQIVASISNHCTLINDSGH